MTYFDVSFCLIVFFIPKPQNPTLLLRFPFPIFSFSTLRFPFSILCFSFFIFKLKKRPGLLHPRRRFKLCYFKNNSLKLLGNCYVDSFCCCIVPAGLILELEAHCVITNIGEVTDNCPCLCAVTVINYSSVRACVC